MNLPEQILQLLKDQAKEDPDKYINPYFLMAITNALYDYYKVEDDEVDIWVRDMYYNKGVEHV